MILFSFCPSLSGVFWLSAEPETPQIKLLKTLHKKLQTAQQTHGCLRGRIEMKRARAACGGAPASHAAFMVTQFQTLFQHAGQSILFWIMLSPLDLHHRQHFDDDLYLLYVFSYKKKIVLKDCRNLILKKHKKVGKIKYNLHLMPTYQSENINPPSLYIGWKKEICIVTYSYFVETLSFDPEPWLYKISIKLRSFFYLFFFSLQKNQGNEFSFPASFGSDQQQVPCGSLEDMWGLWSLFSACFCQSLYHL